MPPGLVFSVLRPHSLPLSPSSASSSSALVLPTQYNSTLLPWTSANGTTLKTTAGLPRESPLLKSILHCAYQSLTITHSWFIFYSCFFPFLTLVHGLIDTFCFALGSLYPMYALVVSATFLIGWIVQISFWFQCDYFPDYTKCYQFYVVGRSDSQSAGSLVGVSDGVTAAKVALGMVLLVL